MPSRLIDHSRYVQCPLYQCALQTARLYIKQPSWSCDYTNTYKYIVIFRIIGLNISTGTLFMYIYILVESIPRHYIDSSTSFFVSIKIYKFERSGTYIAVVFGSFHEKMSAHEIHASIKQHSNFSYFISGSLIKIAANYQYYHSCKNNVIKLSFW